MKKNYFLSFIFCFSIHVLYAQYDENTHYQLHCAWLGKNKVLTAMQDNSVKMTENKKSKEQLWQIKKFGENYRIVSVINPNKSLALAKNNKSLRVLKNTEEASQQWIIKNKNETSVSLSCLLEGEEKSIDIINNGSETNSDTPHLTKTGDYSGQFWSITPIKNKQNNNNSNGGNLDEMAKVFLAEHNRIRAERNVPPLTWSKELADYANEWATNLASNCNFEHRQNGKYGENLAMGGMGANPTEYVKLWESEKKAFDQHFGNGGKCCGGKFGGYGHYSQIVWKNTTQVGCAMVKCSDGTYIVVCNYNPPGNMQGEKPY